MIGAKIFRKRKKKSGKVRLNLWRNFTPFNSSFNYFFLKNSARIIDMGLFTWYNIYEQILFSLFFEARTTFLFL